MNKDKSLFVYLLLVAMLGIQICSQCQTVIKLVHTKKSHYECSRMHMSLILIKGIFSYRLNCRPALGICLFFNVYVCRMISGKPKHSLHCHDFVGITFVRIV